MLIYDDNLADFINTFVTDLDIVLGQLKSNAKLGKLQKYWLGFCLTGILLTNSVNWAKFERASLGGYRVAALSWMFRQSKISWPWLLVASVSLILKSYDIKEAVVVVDESDHARSKQTKRIYGVRKQKHKPSNGYVYGQTIVMLLLVTKTLTFPVGFAFYRPDPALTAWAKEDKRLKKQGVAKKDRPVKPVKNSAYPTKVELALGLLQAFKSHHSNIRVNGVLADALYGEAKFLDGADEIMGGTQVISQIRANQTIEYKGKKRSVTDYFTKTNVGVGTVVTVRGGQTVKATVSSARLKVCAHGKKRLVVALKWDGEEEYRYLVASDMTWRTQDVIQAYTLRWLIEVFFEDWKLYEGWGQEAKQFDKEGSSQGLILSLLFDHCLLLHPEQSARIENKLPALTVGSLQRKAQMIVLLEVIKKILEQENPAEKLQKVAKQIDEVFRLMPSKKHLIGRDLGRLEPTASLLYRRTA